MVPVEGCYQEATIGKLKEKAAKLRHVVETISHGLAMD